MGNGELLLAVQAMVKKFLKKFYTTYCLVVTILPQVGDGENLNTFLS